MLQYVIENKKDNIMALQLVFVLDETGLTDLKDVQGTDYQSSTGLTHRFVAVEGAHPELGNKLFQQDVFQIEDLEDAIVNYTSSKKKPVKTKKTKKTKKTNEE